LEGEVLWYGDVVLPTISMFTRPFMGGAFGQLKGLEKRKKECVLILIF
jgi:hypothetical protein